MKIVLMGPPASGKGTVGKLLSNEIDLPIFSVGKLFRNVPSESPFYNDIHEFMDKGKLVPGEIPAKLIRDEITQDKYKNGYILDGWLRDLTQKDFFDPEADYVVFINISEETSLKRISGRRICPKDNFSCNIYTLPPKDPSHCDLCGGKLVHRDDDKEEVVVERLKLYHNDTLPVIDYFRKQGNLLEVSGEGTPEEVLGLIILALSKND